jgi:hypothetical protein
MSRVKDKDIVEQVTNPLWIEPTASVEFNVDSNLAFMGVDIDDSRYGNLFEQACARLEKMGICLTTTS